MRNHHPGAALQQRLQRPLHLFLGGWIEARRRLVEDDDVRIAQQHARQRQPLRLAGRQRQLRAAEDGIQPVRLRREPRQQVQAVERVHDAVVVDGIVEQRQVVADGAAEELHFLGDHCDPGAHHRQPERTQVDAVHGDAAAVGVVQPRQQAGDGGLAAAGAPQNAERTPRRDGKREVAQHHLFLRLISALRHGRVTEADALQGDAERPAREPPACPIDERAARRQQPLNADQVAARLLQLLHLMRQVLERPEQQVDVAEHQVEGAEGHVAAQRQHTAPRHHQAGADPHHHVHRRPHQGTEAVGASGTQHLGRDQGIHPAHGMHQAAEYLDLLYGGQPLLHESMQIGGRLAQPFVVGHAEAAQLEQHRGHRHGEQQQRQAQLPVLDQQRDQDPHQQQSPRQQAQRELREEGGKLIGVAVHALLHRPRRVPPDDAHVEAHGVVEQIGAQPVGGAPCDALAEIRRQPAGELTHRRHRQKQGRGAHHCGRGASGKQVIHDAAQKLRRVDSGGGVHHEHQRQQRDLAPAVSQIAGQKTAVESE